MTAASTSFDPAPEALDFIHERLGFLRAHAEVAQIECDVGDLIAVGYALKRATVELKAAIGTFNELLEEKRKIEARREAA
jgi:hypothetical protein